MQGPRPATSPWPLLARPWWSEPASFVDVAQHRGLLREHRCVPSASPFSVPSPSGLRVVEALGHSPSLPSSQLLFLCGALDHPGLRYGRPFLCPAPLGAAPEPPPCEAPSHSSVAFPACLQGEPCVQSHAQSAPVPRCRPHGGHFGRVESPSPPPQVSLDSLEPAQAGPCRLAFSIPVTSRP